MSIPDDFDTDLEDELTLHPDQTVAATGPTGRIPVQKTYKLYIGGAFPRTESGRYYKVHQSDGELLANMCQASRKDFREAVKAARSAFGGWSARSAFNRGQILYRIAEMLEGRRAQFASELVQQGASPSEAEKEVTLSIDRVVYYAGWADKYQQIFSSVNPVSSSHFNFSVLEPTGVVAAIAPDKPSLSGLLSLILPSITGGNAVIALASQSQPLCAITLAEVLDTSDLPGGVVNLLTGSADELAGHFASHMDVNALIMGRKQADMLRQVQETAAENVKRVVDYGDKTFGDPGCQDPYFILDTQETKTTWHPIGI